MISSPSLSLSLSSTSIVTPPPLDAVVAPIGRIRTVRDLAMKS